MKKTLSLFVATLTLMTLVAGGTAWARGGGGRAGGGARAGRATTTGRSGLDRRRNKELNARLIQDRAEAENRDSILRDELLDSI